MSSSPRILISGGGIAGNALALQLGTQRYPDHRRRTG